ncbi:ANTAR domain-containing protein [Mycobacterium sp. 852002-51057_SCH5723018]|uniref:ANTAR domain-containing protein n=1 Tax=Mycobacterium sp. 852002-51057_SCH5723018 TaxID=1834094 RepID=UPI000A9CFA34|nr:ANTAR domain-containing protein [Mycobacterium sp. 852002-51057_SCH5723018]
MAPNERIEQGAVALLTEHFQLDDEQALGVLRKLAERAEMPIREVAELLIDRDKLGRKTGRDNLLAVYLTDERMNPRQGDR